MSSRRLLSRVLSALLSGVVVLLAAAVPSAEVHATEPGAVNVAGNRFTNWSAETTTNVPFVTNTTTLVSGHNANGRPVRYQAGAGGSAHGDHVVKLTSTAATTEGKFWTRGVDRASQKWATYTAKIWVRKPVASGKVRNIDLWIRELSPTNGYVGGVTHASVSLNDVAWKPLTVSYTAANDGNSIEILVRDNAVTGGTDRVVYVDAITLTASTPPASCETDPSIPATDPRCLRPVLSGLVNVLVTEKPPVSDPNDPGYDAYINYQNRLDNIEATADALAASSQSTQQYATINVDWSEVNPEPGVFDFSAIDQILRWYDGDPTDVTPNRPGSSQERVVDRRLRFRLRIAGGNAAPPWVKDETGGCLPVSAAIVAAFSAPGCIPRFWSAGYLERYRELMEAIAARYDQVDGDFAGQVVEVTNSACSTAYTEPFILGIGSANPNADADGNGVLDGAQAKQARMDLWDWTWDGHPNTGGLEGYTKGRHGDCITTSSQIMEDEFDHIRFSVAVHKYWEWTNEFGQFLGKQGVSGSHTQREAFNELSSLVAGLRTAHGEQLVLDEHGTRVGSVPVEPIAGESTVSDGHVYWMLQNYASATPGTEFGLQFNGPAEQSVELVRKASEWGASNFEWAWFQWMTEAEIRELHAALSAN